MDFAIIQVRSAAHRGIFRIRVGCSSQFWTRSELCFLKEPRLEKSKIERYGHHDRCQYLEDIYVIATVRTKIWWGNFWQGNTWNI